MARCETCGNDCDKAFQVSVNGTTHTFDSFECAIHALAPTCDNCGIHIVGHGLEKESTFYCCEHCADAKGVKGLRDRIVRRGRYFKQKEWPEEISRIAIRQHDNLDWALLIFGPRVCAREIIRRHRIECAQNNCKYDREYAIDQAAKMVGLDRERLVNWLNRSKRARNAKRYGSSSPV